jgi:hypothetical protein
MRRRRINLTKEALPKWFVKAKRKLLKMMAYSKGKSSRNFVNEEYD